MRSVNSFETDSQRQMMEDLLKPRKASLEVTGLGIIAALIAAAGLLVFDGTLRLHDYLVFAAFLLVSAGGLAWRLMRSGA